MSWGRLTKACCLGFSLGSLCPQRYGCSFPLGLGRAPVSERKGEGKRGQSDCPASVVSSNHFILNIKNAEVCVWNPSNIKKASENMKMPTTASLGDETMASLRVYLYLLTFLQLYLNCFYRKKNM